MKPRVLLLYEYSVVGLAHSSSHIRLLRPLSYPTVQDRFEITPVPIYTGQPSEIVIVDRTWRPEINGEMAAALIKQIQSNGAKLLYQLDDDLFSLPLTPSFTAAQHEAVEVFARGADALLVSTATLAERVAAYNRRIHIVANALDERLLVPHSGQRSSLFADSPVVIGYMGTMTHDRDLALVFDALREVSTATTVPLELQIIGVARETDTWMKLRSLPFPVRMIEPPTVEYPHFLSWFTGNVHWDIGLAPLQDTPFNRCKSDVKFLDYSAAGIPGIFSRGPVYTPSVEDGVTGLLVDASVAEWRHALLSLITHSELRRELAVNAQRHLLRERTLAQRSDEWIAVLEEVLYG